MAAQVEVQTGEVGRAVAAARLLLSPLTDSNNQSLIEIPAINQAHIIDSELNKPVPCPKPRLTPKPFAVERNPTIKPILAPKPHTKPRPESTRLAGHKPDPPSTPKPTARPVSTNPNRPAPTSFKMCNKLNTGQTTKPVVQPFKPAPPLHPGDPTKPTLAVPAERQKPSGSSLAHSKSHKRLSAAEWSGTTTREDEKGQKAQNKGGTSITRAKSMGFLAQVGQEEERKEKVQPEVSVPLRPKPRSSRPRPVSAIFPISPTNAESPVPVPRWRGRRPLSADLTSKFESIGLSLHCKSPKANTKENTSEEKPLPPKREQGKTPKSTTSQSSESTADPTLTDQTNKKTEETAVKDAEEDKCGASIKSRISLFLDSPSTPGAGATSQVSDLPSPVPQVHEIESPVGVKQLIKQLTEDVTPTQSPVIKPVQRPRPLQFDLTQRFSSERSPDLVSLTEAADRHEIGKDPQRGAEESATTPNDQKMFLDSKDFSELLKKPSTPEWLELGQTNATFKESGPGAEVHTVRASLFENVVERHSVMVMDEGKSVNTAKDSLSSPLFNREAEEDDGTLVTASYKEPVSQSSPLRVLHAFDTVQAVEENRAVSESVQTAQWEDKAMTLRSRRSEVGRPVVERTDPTQAQPASAAMPEPQLRYLRVGALQKWTTTGLEQDTGLEKGMLKESQREAQLALDKDGEKQRIADQDEVGAAPKRLKMLQTEEQPKPRATYFALTGQMQESVSPGDAGANFGDMTAPFEDFSVRSALGGSQGKILAVRRNPSLDEALGKTSQSQEQLEEMIRSQMSSMELRSQMDEQTKEEMTEVEKKRERKKEADRHRTKVTELEREKQKHLEMEKQTHLEYARMKEREMQREFERQRQKAFEKEKQEFEEKQRALERQKLLELERQRLQEFEKEKQLQLEKEKQEQERKSKMDKDKLQEREREREKKRQKQRDEERQRELDRERWQLEIQREKQKMEEMERQKLLEFQKQKQREEERQQLIEQERQRLRERKEREEAEKLRQVALEQEMLRIKELEKERLKHREMERQKEFEKQRELEREKQRRLDFERQGLENQKQRQHEQREKQRKEDLERIKEMERIQLFEFEKQKQSERERQQLLELEKHRLKEKMEREEAEKRDNAEKLRLIARQQEAERQRLLELEKRRLKEKMEREEAEKMRLIARHQEAERQQLLELEKRRLIEKMEREEAEKRDNAEKMRLIARQQEAERQRLKEKQRKEEQERLRLESSALKTKVLDLDSVFRNDLLCKAASQWSDPATRWKEPYKPVILDIDSFTSQAQLSPGKDLFPATGFQSPDADYGVRLQPTPERDVTWKIPSQTSGGFSSPVWTTSPQDPWELQPVEMSVDKPEPRKSANKLHPEQLLLRQEEHLPSPQRTWSAFLDEPHHLAPFPVAEVITGNSSGRSSRRTPGEQIWIPREPHPPQESKEEIQSHRRSQGSQELNRMRSRSVSRRSAPSSSAEEGSLSRMRSRSAHRDQDRRIWVQQKQSGEEEGKDSETPICETDSQYGTWETGLRTDDSLTPATPSSDGYASPSPRKPTPLHSPGDQASQFETDILDVPHPPSSSESQTLLFPDAPTTLLDTSALRSRAQLGKKRAPRTRPSRAAHQVTAQAEGDGGTSEDWLYRDSTEPKAENKDDDSESEEQARGADGGPAVASQPQRIALFPGVDPSALKAQLKKRGDSDNQTDGPTPSPSQPSRSPKSPFLPRAARVLPTPGGKENGEEESPQWLKELKSKKRLSHYENEC
ncbi:uncharacterized protein PAE49_006604 [Odontesthes bonariensis]|uniref:uncharacterized protein LOC142382487 n=1 Tax=Odontesthes bonariensis TaxID=219752 RepID=UPI003F583DA0